MGGDRVFPRAGVLFIVTAACVGTPTLDLSENEQLYRPTRYRAAVAPDRGAFVLPVVDRRQAQAADAARTAPTTRLDDGAWARPPASMIDAILRRELEDSGVFAALAARAQPDACIVQVTLENFDAGIQEHTTGRRSYGAVTLALQVHGPATAGGERGIAIDERLAESLLSDVVMRPPSPRVLLGTALQRAMQRLLAAIDQGNVARSQVPLDDR